MAMFQQWSSLWSLEWEMVEGAWMKLIFSSNQNRNMTKLYGQTVTAGAAFQKHYAWPNEH
jgi:hypothetical protein